MSFLSPLDQLSKKLAFSEAEKYGAPSAFHIELSHHVGQRLAIELHANAEIVSIGTYLMDCMLGLALDEKRPQDHVAMSIEKAEGLLNTFTDIKSEDRKNILACVREHHGVKSFFSLESEICCNADCYRFASTEGFIGGIHHGRAMSVDELIELYQDKLEEKWRALSLESCKKELKTQREVIQQLISTYISSKTS